MTCWPTKRRWHCDHILCDVTSPYVYIALQSNRQCYPTTTTIMIGTFARRNIAFAHCTTPSAPKIAQNTISSHRSVQSLHGKNSCRLRVYTDNEKLLKMDAKCPPISTIEKSARCSAACATEQRQSSPRVFHSNFTSYRIVLHDRPTMKV